MAEAVGIAAAALSFLKAAKTCLSVLHAIQQNTPQSHRVLHLRLEAQAIKFREWCQILGVQEMIATTNRQPETWHESDDIEIFQERLRIMLRFDNEGVAAYLLQTLLDMENIFRRAREKLTQQRHLASSAQHSASRADKSFMKTFSWLRKINGSKKPRADVMSKSGTNFSGDLLARASSLVADVKWATMDKKTFEQLLGEICEINKCLRTFLSDEARMIVHRRVQADILRNTDIQAGLVHDSGLIQGDAEVQTLSRLKDEVQKVEKADAKCTESIQNEAPNSAIGDISSGAFPQPPILEMTDFPQHTVEFGPSRSVSVLWGKPVLIEWTHYGKAINLDQFYRRAHLMRLLNDANIFQKLNALRSSGVLRDPNKSRIGLVFDIPGVTGASIQENTLLDLLDSNQCAMGQRYALAQKLSTALHNLLCVNWLHKSIRSDNIVYFDDNPGGVATAVTLGQEFGSAAGLTKRSCVEPGQASKSGSEGFPPMLLKLPQLYLLGWSVSRPDKPSEMSESISISTDQYKLTKEMIRLSSHPESLQEDESGKKPRFKPEYDVYSFGLLLLEIGLWKPMTALRQRCSSDDQFRERVAGVYSDMLLSSMGEIYWKATKRCLSGDFDLKVPEDRSPAGADKRIPFSVAFEQQVVTELEKCMA